MESSPPGHPGQTPEGKLRSHHRALRRPHRSRDQGVRPGRGRRRRSFPSCAATFTPIRPTSSRLGRRSTESRGEIVAAPDGHPELDEAKEMLEMLMVYQDMCQAVQRNTAAMIERIESAHSQLPFRAEAG